MMPTSETAKDDLNSSASSSSSQERFVSTKDSGPAGPQMNDKIMRDNGHSLVAAMLLRPLPLPPTDMPPDRRQHDHPEATALSTKCLGQNALERCLASLADVPAPLMAASIHLKTPVASSSDLHMLCCNESVATADIYDALCRNFAAASQPAKAPTLSKVYNPRTGHVRMKKAFETYTYPLNLAIRHNASFDVIRILLDAAPDVTNVPDGLECESSLHVMLKHRPNFVRGIDALLLHNPQPTSPVDRRNNTLLHTACRYGAPLTVVRRLVILYPDALQTRNFCNELPLHIAQRSSVMCSDDVASFVWQQSNKGPWL